MVVEPFNALTARHTVIDEQPPEVTRVSLSAALASDDDPQSILGYLAGLGIAVTRLSDLLLINRFADEEELYAHKVVEGVAISVASENLWVLFEP